MNIRHKLLILGDSMLAEVKNICVIEDEVDIADSIKTYFEASDFSVILFQNAEDFYQDIPDDFKGIYLVDWNLPGAQGIDIIKRIRQNDKVSPVFMVSAFSNQDQIIEGLSSGADDYITKPFSLEELKVRVSNSLKKFSIVDSQISKDRIQLLPEANSFIIDGQTISLTSREYTLFNALFESEGEPVSRDQLIEKFSNDEKITARNIDVHVFSLRKKIKAANLLIETVWGKGYKLVEL